MELATTLIALSSLMLALAVLGLVAWLLYKGVNIPNVELKPVKPYTQTKTQQKKFKPRAKDDVMAWLEEQEEKR